jgi:hypothetical protein
MRGIVLCRAYGLSTRHLDILGARLTLNVTPTGFPSFPPLYTYRALENISCTWIFIPLSDLDSDTSAANSVRACGAKFCFAIDLVTSRGSWLCLVIRGYVPFVGVAGSYCRIVFLNSHYSAVYWIFVLYFTRCYVCFVIVNCYVT